MKKSENFRFDIGALRAFAVLIVVLFHFKIEVFSGGYLGVDIFFVISGFLMTKIILTGFIKNSFNLKQFYIKRMTRIIPLLIVVGFIVLLISSVLFFNTDLRQNAKNVILSNLLISNLYYWLYNGYFDSASQNNIFLHSWSLAVEWQFYLLYPLLLLPFKKTYLNSPNRFNFFFLSFTFISLVMCLYITKFDNSFGFYMFPTRAWEMTLGGVAFLYTGKLINITQKQRTQIAVLGYALLLGSLLLIDETFLWPSYFTILPTLGTFIIIIANSQLNWTKNKFIQLLGDISYSLYLWHWPIYITAQYFGIQAGVNILYMMILSCILALLSYYFIEQKSFFSSIRFVAIGTTSVVLLGLWIFLHPSDPILKKISLYDKNSYKLANYANDYNKNIRPKQYNSKGCFITIGDNFEDFKYNSCLHLDSTKKNILLLGDSHAAQYSQSLLEQLPTSVNLIELNAGMTFPFRTPKGKKESVRLINKFYENFYENNINSIDLIILSVHWPMHTNPKLNYSEEELTTSYQEFLQELNRKKIPVLIIGQQMTYTLDFSKIIVIASTFANEKGEQYYKKYIDKKSLYYHNLIKEITPKENYINVYDQSEIEKLNKDGVPYMVDGNHFSKDGADQVIRKLVIPKIIEINDTTQ